MLNFQSEKLTAMALVPSITLGLLIPVPVPFQVRDYFLTQMLNRFIRASAQGVDFKLTKGNK